MRLLYFICAMPFRKAHCFSRELLSLECAHGSPLTNPVNYSFMEGRFIRDTMLEDASSATFIEQLH